MATTPLVSICLPVFNGERYLSNACESVLAQTLQDFELLIADDGSTDSSVAIAEKFARQDRRIKFWVNSNRKGLFGNYNEILFRSSGRYIKTFAQDDLFAPQILERMVEVLEKHKEVTLVSCSRNVIDSENKITKVKKIFPQNISLQAKEVLTFNLINLQNWIGEPSTVMFAKKNIGTGFDTNYYHYGDIDYWFRILEGAQYYYLSDVLCSFRQHAESQTNKNHRELLSALDILRLSLKYRHVLADIEPQEVFIRRIAEIIALEFGHTADAVGEDFIKQFSLSFIKDNSQQGDNSNLEEAQFGKTQKEGFRLLAAFALKVVSELTADLDHEKRCRFDEHERFAREVNKMQNSPYWKLTDPVRKIKHWLKQ